MCSLSLNNFLLLDEVGMAEWARIVKYFRRSFGWVVFSYKVDLSPGRINFVDPDGSQSDIDVDVLAEVLGPLHLLSQPQNPLILLVCSLVARGFPCRYPRFNLLKKEYSKRQRDKLLG